MPGAHFIYLHCMRISTVIFLLAAYTANAQQEADSFYLVRSSAKLTMLATGLGEDRLGGAKIGYIDSSVLLRIIDSAKDQYLVHLSENHTAYISNRDCKPDTTTQLRPYYLTNSFSVKGDDAYDYVNISLDERLPYKSWMEINPSKIFIDIYGVQSNTNWITQLKNVKEIKNVYFNQVEDDVVRVTIELQHQQHWGYSINYKDNLLSVRVRRQPSPLKLSNLVIAIDPGHGGSNSGATGVTSKAFEKNFTLRFANELDKRIRKKIRRIIMTRNSDTTFNNIDRALFLQSEMPDLLISLHFNSSSNQNVNGASTYYKHIGFRSLTTAILDRLLELNVSEFGNVGNFNFTLNALTDFPGSLVEIAFLSNPADEQKILDAHFQREVAKKIHKGIKDWVKIAKR